jgi:hypothetical protein
MPCLVRPDAFAAATEGTHTESPGGAARTVPARSLWTAWLFRTVTRRPPGESPAAPLHAGKTGSGLGAS